MGDRANVYVVDEQDPAKGVYLYTHWSGTELPETVRQALLRKLRWNDCQYLTRIIFDQMTEGNHGAETGFGISASVGDGDERIVRVNALTQTVDLGHKAWPFDEYIREPRTWPEKD